MKYIKILFGILLITMLTGCYDGNEVNDRVYPLFLGLDKATSGNLLITIKFPTYTGGSNSSGGSSGESEGEEKLYNQGSSNVYTVEAPTIFSGMQQLLTSLSREVSLSHVEFFCVSQELARDGIVKYMLSLERDSQSTVNMKVIVIEESASEFIKEHKATMSSNFAREANLIPQKAGIDTGYNVVRFGDFYASIYAPYKDGVAARGGLANHDSMENIQGSEGVDKMKNQLSSGVSPGSSTIKSPQKTEVTGISVFCGEKLAGFLNAYESSLYAMVVGQFDGEMSFRDPQKLGEFLSITLHKNLQPTIKGYEKDGQRYVDVKIPLDGQINGIQAGTQYETEEKIDEFDRYISQQIQYDVTEMIKKVQKEYKADIFGFGSIFIKNYKTMEEWEAVKWFEQYPKCNIRVTVEYRTRRTGVIFLDQNNHTVENFVKFKERG